MAWRPPPDRTRPMTSPPRGPRSLQRYAKTGPSGRRVRRQPPVSGPPPGPAPTAGYIPWWMLLVVVMVVGAVFVISWVAVLAVRSGNPPRPSPTAVVVVMFPTAGPPGSEATLEVALPPQPTATIPPAPAGDLNLGDSVRVIGTGGDGLRLRVGPGLQETPNYLALENEVLVVQSGPSIADGFTWWFLVDPADDTRNGWAVENYLEVVGS